MITYPGSLMIQQRVLPAYRAPFFDQLAARCEGGLVVYAGDPLPGEALGGDGTLHLARHVKARNIHRFKPGHMLYRCRQPEFVPFLKSASPDALVLEANPRYPDNRAAAGWMQRSGRPVLGWGLGAGPLHGPGRRIRARARKQLLSVLDGIIAYSSQGAREYQALGVLPKSAIFTAHNAVSPPPEGPAAQPGKREHPLHLLFVGRLQQRKRVDLLFAACAHLPEALRPRITIVGDGPERSFFEDFASRFYTHPVEFTGALHGEALAGHFLDADLFVLPGTGGLAIQEAMGYGLPVIAAEGDGTQRDLVRPENGWLILPGDQTSLELALTDALIDRDGLSRRGAAGRRIVEEEINIRTMADQFIAALLAVSETT